MKKFAYFGLYPKCLNLEGFTPLVGMMFVTIGRYIALARARLVKKKKKGKECVSSILRKGVGAYVGILFNFKGEGGNKRSPLKRLMNGVL